MGDSAIISINTQLRYLFAATNYTDPDVPLFYDQAAHFVDSRYWGHHNTVDTIDPYVWTTIHEEFFWTQFDTTRYEHIGEFYEHVNQLNNDTIDVGILRLSYYKLNDSVLYDSAYYFFDTINLQYTDNVNRTAEPYVQKRMFVATAFSLYTNTWNPVFRISPENIVVDSTTLLTTNLDTKPYSLIIDLGDSQGWQTVDPGAATYVAGSYTGSGSKVARTAVVDNNTLDTIDFSQFNIIVTGNGIPMEDPTETYNDIDTGINVGIYSSCDAIGNGTFGEKFIIYVEGFDFFQSISIRDNYYRLKAANIAELRNHGYNIVIINLKHPGEGIEKNAMRVVKVIDKLKCALSTGDLDTLNQFVVIGESMGAVIARYALSWMEANPTISPCRPDLMHNTRLFISYDGPQDGAYIPMAFQELYNHYAKLLFLPFHFRNDLKNRLDMLNCDASKDLLKHHQTTNPFNATLNPSIYDAVYSPSPRRVNLMNDLNQLRPNTDGYPQYCKMMAISNGLMTAEHQVNVTNIESKPGLDYISGTGALYVLIFGDTYNIYNVDLNLSTLDGTTNDFFQFKNGIKTWKIVIPTIPIHIGICPICIRKRIPWGWPSFQVDYTISNQYSRFSTTTPTWDVMPGGQYDFAEIAGLLPTGDLPFPIMIQAQTIGPVPPFGVTVTSPQFSIIWGLNIDLTMEMNRFNFIPIQSAFDYKQVGHSPFLDHDIYTEPLAIMLSRTPFDVITGEINGLPGYPQITQTHNYPRNRFDYPGMNNGHFNIIRNHRRNDSLVNSDTALYTNPLYAFYINREIGEEELMLENFELNRTALFETEYFIYAGIRLNPYYEYPGMATQRIFLPYAGIGGNPNVFGYDQPNNGIFSKEETFDANNGLAVLKTDSIIDVTVNGGMLGPHIDIFQPQLVCVLDFWCYPNTGCSNKRSGKEPKKEEASLAENYLSIYPNPVEYGEYFQVNTQGHFFDRVSITDLQGRTLMDEKLYIAYENLRISSKEAGLVAGIYVINLHSGENGTLKSIKLVVQ